ncbi:MAG: VOC family protein [Rhodospirillales bacterium]
MQITHLAYSLASPEDAEAAKDHLEQVYGLKYISTRPRRGLYTIDMTDGNMALALTYYQDDAPTLEATAAGPRPNIHHIGFDVDDFGRYADDVIENDYELFSAPGQVPVKFRAPGGTVAEFAPAPFFVRRATEKTPLPIKHIALRLPSREIAVDASEYYMNVWGFRSDDVREKDDRYTHDLSDGKLTFAVTYHPDDCDGPPRIHHIGFEVDDFEEHARAIQDAGHEVLTTPGKVPFRYIAPGGTAVEFVPAPYFSKRI